MFVSPRTCPHTANCDFEDDEHEYCSWINIESSAETVQWDVHSSADSNEFGPVPDNTLDSLAGHFMLTSASQSGLYSRLISENIEPADTDQIICLSFYFFFPTIAEYNLTVRLAEYNSSEVILWSLSDLILGQNIAYNAWNLGQVAFETEDSFRVFFDGYVGTDPKYFVGTFVLLIFHF